MLDRKFIIENAEAIKQNCISRGITVDIDRFVRLEPKRKAIQDEVESLNRQATRIREQTHARQTELNAVAGELYTIRLMIPDMAHPGAPIIPPPENWASQVSD